MSKQTKLEAAAESGRARGVEEGKLIGMKATLDEALNRVFRETV